MSTLLAGKNIVPALVVINIVFGAAAIISAMPALMSVMMFDAPGSQNNKLVWFTFYGIVSFPILGVLSIPMSWLFYFFKKHGLALGASVSPLLSIAWVVLGFALIGMLCDGNFSCDK